MSKGSFRLPGQDLPELEKVVRAYCPYHEELSPQELAERAAVPKVQISRNAGFLVDFGVLEEQSKHCYKYKLGPRGRRLADALSEEPPDRGAWCDILDSSGHLHSILQPLRVGQQQGTDKERFVQSLFQMAKKTGQTHELSERYKRGATALIEVLKVAGIVEEKEHKLFLLLKNKCGTSDNNALLSTSDIDWSFVTDGDLKELLKTDYNELAELRDNDKVPALKSKLVLCGSILEAVLVSILSQDEQSAKDQYKTLYLKQKSPGGKVPPLSEPELQHLIEVVKTWSISADAQSIREILEYYQKLVREKQRDPKVPDLDDWKLQQLIDVSRGLDILDDNGKRIAIHLKDYRNLVHPMVAMRRVGTILDLRIVASVLFQLDYILDHLSKRKTS